MVRRLNINEHQARRAIETGEFDSEVICSAERVAVVLTQGWCSDWLAMDAWLQSLVKLDTPRTAQIDVWELVYDRVSYFREFLEFKETTLGNCLVPYVRYYIGGRLASESNYLRSGDFLARFDAPH